MNRLGDSDRLLVVIAMVVVVAAIGVRVWTRAGGDASIGGATRASAGVEPKANAGSSSAGSSAAYAAPVLPPTGAQATPAPPPPGPGAGVPFDPATAPVVPPGTSTDAYVTTYFDALLAGDWATAADMVPKADAAQSVDQFRALLEPYAPQSFTIFNSAESSESGTTLVFTFTAENGAWNVEWEWAETPRGLAVKDVRYARPGGTACH